MIEGGKTSKLKEIKETVFGAVEIIRQAGKPDVQESFGKMMDIAMVAREIIEALKSPEMVKNIENFRLISNNINEISAKMQDTLKQLEGTGVINEAAGLIKSTKSAIDLFGNNGQDLFKKSVAVMEILGIIKEEQVTFGTEGITAELIGNK